MTEAILFMLALGAACGGILGIASKIFYVYEDPRIAEVEGSLAGANCGGCGYAGCSAAASAVVSGKAPPSVCLVAGPESAAAVAGILGIDPGTAETRQSIVQCYGGDRAADRYYYFGANSCRALDSLFGGKRECDIGCLGMGDCVRSCTFNALSMGPDGFPVVDESKCVGCGACERACPKNVITIKTMSDKLLHFNRVDECLAPCRQTCPAEINIPRYIAQIKKGDFAGAVSTIRERNPLLLACGRVCPHPCEEYCRRSIADDPVSINQLKRFVADFEMSSGRRLPVTCAPLTGKKVAVIGGGPAGLSCAYFLRRLGHEVTIFEAMPKLGGMIRYGIPEYRLPKKVLEWEIQGILDLGIKAHTNTRLGVDFTIESLTGEGYNAVFLGVGAWKDYKLNVEGEDLSGCYTGIDFLTRFARKQQGDAPNETLTPGIRCAVVGGGNTAIDCVRTLIRLGAQEVTLVYRRTRKEMPANEVEIEAAEHEGVKFAFLAAPVRVVGDEKGHVKQLEYLKMELGEPDASGRRRPVPVKGSETLLDVDMLITAIGQGPDVSFKEKEAPLKDLQITRHSTIQTGDPQVLQTNIPHIFTAGDAATGASLVVEAIGGGRRAARAIHLYLTGQEVKAPLSSLFKTHVAESIFETIAGVEPLPRVRMPELPVDERIKSFEEADLVITEPEALQEAARCLVCGRSCYNRTREVKEEQAAA